MKLLRLLLLLTLGLFPLCVKGQELLFGLTNQTEAPLTVVDSISLYALLDRGYKIQKKRPDLALQYYDLALSRCTSGYLALQKPKVYSYFTSCYVDHKDYYTAIDFARMSVEGYLQQGKHPFKQLSSLCGLYVQVGAYDQAITVYHGSLSRPPLNAIDTYFMRKMLCNVAAGYAQLGRSDSASLMYYKVIESAPANDTSYDSQLRAYTGLANTAMQLEQWDKTRSLVDKAMVIAIMLKDSVQIVNMLANKGTICYQQKKYEEAKAYHYPALEFARRKKNTEMIFKSAHILGAIRSKERQFPEAQRLARESYDNAVLNKLTLQWLSASYLMGCVHTHTGQYNIALKYLVPAVQYAEEYKDLAGIADGYDHLSTVYAGLGQYKKALLYRERQLRLWDTMSGKENAGRVAAVEMQYKTAQKDKLIAQKELLLSRQQHYIREKNILIGTLSAGGLLLVLVLAGMAKRRQQKEKLHKVSILNMEKDREIIALKAKMEGEEEERARLARDLHDGVVVKFSAVKMNLSVLPERHGSLEDASDFKQIISRLDEATTELRATAHNLLPETLLEGGLSEAVHYFCKDIQQSSGILIDFQQYADMPRFQAGFELSVYRIIQETVQNVLKHAAATSILVQMIYDGTLLNITVEDNGKGFDTGNGAGMGLRNLRARVTSLQGYLDIRSSPGQGTSVYMEFTPPLFTD